MNLVRVRLLEIVGESGKWSFWEQKQMFLLCYVLLSFSELSQRIDLRFFFAAQISRYILIFFEKNGGGVWSSGSYRAPKC